MSKMRSFFLLSCMSIALYPAASAYAEDIGFIKFSFINKTDKTFKVSLAARQGWVASCEKGVEIAPRTSSKEVICTAVFTRAAYNHGQLHIKRVKKGPDEMAEVENIYGYLLQVWGDDVFKMVAYNSPEEEHTDRFKVSFTPPRPPVPALCNIHNGDGTLTHDCDIVQEVIISPPDS
ncbi:hypothetical protein BH10PSE19_BH10PSE19_21250 [soil metagenome]